MNQASQQKDGAITFQNWYEPNEGNYDFGMCIDDDKADLLNTICISFEAINHRPNKWIDFEGWSKQHKIVLNWNRRVTSKNSIYHPYIFWQIVWEDDIFDANLEPTFNDDERQYLMSFAGANKNAHQMIRDLYSARNEFISEAVDMLEPSDFKLFGSGWNDIKRFEKHLAGTVKSKSDTVRHAAFSFCIENQTDEKWTAGYATEKIYDALRNGAVPIYQGAPDILDFVPADCFIPYDGNPKKTLEMIIEDFDMKTWLGYNKRIKKYIQSDQYKKLVDPGELYVTLRRALS